MENKMKKMVLMVVICIVSILSAGCANTVSAFGGLMKGVGEDMQTMCDPYLHNQQNYNASYTRTSFYSPNGEHRR